MVLQAACPCKMRNILYPFLLVVVDVETFCNPLFFDQRHKFAYPVIRESKFQYVPAVCAFDFHNNWVPVVSLKSTFV